MKKEITDEGSVFLDFFRGMSAQMVLIGHLLSFYGILKIHNIPVIQNLGVLVFFVLSGYLITRITLIKGNNYDFKSFIIDRFSRIYYSFIPAILFVLSIDLIWYFLFKGYNHIDQFTFKSFFSNLFMLQSFPGLNFEPFGSARTFWTVSIEWWFYVFFGILYYKEKINKTIILLLFTISLLFVLVNVSRRSDLTIYWGIGFLYAVLHNSVKITIRPILFVIAFVFVLLILLLRILSFPDLSDVGIALIFGLLLYLSQNTPEQFNKYITNRHFSSFSKFFASFSFSLYLIHYTLIEFTMNFIKDIKLWEQMLLLFFFCNFIAHFFFLFFEKNNNKLRGFLKVKMKNISI